MLRGTGEWGGGGRRATGAESGAQAAVDQRSCRAAARASPTLTLNLTIYKISTRVVIVYRGYVQSLGGRRGGAAGGGGRGGAGRHVRQRLVQRRVHEARVGVAVHQRVDLQLRLVEGVRRRLHHVAVHGLAHAGVQRHLQPPTISFTQYFLKSTIKLQANLFRFDKNVHYFQIQYVLV